MTSLAKREQRNYQFEFLRPTHSLYSYFTRLVDQYSKILNPTPELFEKLKNNIEDSYSVLGRVMARVNYEAYVDDELKRQQREDEEEKSIYDSHSGVCNNRLA